MNLILTPIYKSFDIVRTMCEAVESLTQNDYLHILIDDDSHEPLPIKATSNRRILSIHRDVEGTIHKNGGANAIQLGYDFAHHPFINEQPNPIFDHVFVIESDVYPLARGWDQKQIEQSLTLPEDWGTLDVQSVDEEGKVTYPCTVSPRHDEFQDEHIEWIHYPDWQCTLFNPKVFEYGMKFNNASSHFDVMFGRRMEELKLKAYRSKDLKALHVHGGGNSRQFLV